MPCIIPMTYGHLLHAIPLSLGGAINGIGLVVGGGNGNACNPAWSWIIPGMAWTCWMITCLSGYICKLATLANNNGKLGQMNKWLHLGAGTISWFYALDGLGCNMNRGV